MVIHSMAITRLTLKKYTAKLGRAFLDIFEHLQGEFFFPDFKTIF